VIEMSELNRDRVARMTAALAKLAGEGRTSLSLVEVAKAATLPAGVAAKMLRTWPYHAVIEKDTKLAITYHRPVKAHGARLRARGRPRVHGAQAARVELAKKETQS